MYNKIVLVGRLTRDPELKYSGGGKAYCRFSIATNDGFGENEETEYTDIVVFNKQAENVGQYTKKGNLVLIEGRKKTSEYENEAGEKRRKVEVIANTVRFLESKREG